MLKKYYRVKRIIGVNGVFVGVEIVYMFGRIQRLWNYRMAPMAGLDLFWMASWQRCIQVVAQKMEMIVLVSEKKHRN